MIAGFRRGEEAFTVGTGEECFSIRRWVGRAGRGPSVPKHHRRLPAAYPHGLMLLVEKSFLYL